MASINDLSLAKQRRSLMLVKSLSVDKKTNVRRHFGRNSWR